MSLIFEDGADVAGFDDDSLDFSLVELGHELTKNHILFWFMMRHAE